MNDILCISARWGLLAATIVAAFWGVWSLFDTVPSEKILLFPAMNDYATVPISRWWDIPGAFLTACFLGTYWRVCDKYEINNPKPSFLGLAFVSMFVVTFFGTLAFGIRAGFLNGLSAGLVLLFAFFAILYFLAAMKQITEWGKDDIYGAYKEVKKEREESKTM